MPPSKREQRLCDVIAAGEQQMLADLATYVAIPTGHNHTAGLNAYRLLLIDRLHAIGAKIELVKGSPRPDWMETPAGKKGGDSTIPPTILARNHKANTPRVLLAGHLDTVHDPDGPFRELKIGPDRRSAVGPGVVDMKGGILIALNALEALHECGIDHHWTFLLNADEETGSFHSYDAIFAAAQQHDIGIALEPALPDGSLVVERMGSGQFKIEVFGKSAHVGRDFSTGISAVTRLAELILMLAAISKPEDGMILNIGPLQGGGATNVVPDFAACWGNVRFSDPKKAAILERALDALATPADSLPRVVVHHAINRPAKPLIDPVRQLAEAARQSALDLGQQLGFGSTGGVCDGNIMQAAGLPTIDTLGVRGGNLHRPDEFIELASLVERSQLLAVLLSRIAEGKIQLSPVA